ncbi:transcription factor Jun-like [Macrobrachium nipponense]|uniref:AP-1 transcription factor subunit n=1 Tax=Macrobrachium nipponense TaxID=159736 RepID=A0A221I039_MACNP|nr:AP-1 transcription factor subunit [Macrobrachium nipponense]
MEATMYEDGSYNTYQRESLTQMKRKLTLDLTRPSKKQRGTTGNFNPLLTSPDLNQLKLASPELERLIIQQNSTILGNTVTTPSQFLFPKTTTLEQEEFAKGFEDTLEQLHNQDGIATSSSGSIVVTSVSDANPPVSSAPLQYTQLDVPTHHHHPHLQQVPVTSSAAPGVSLAVTSEHHVPSQLGLLPHTSIKEEPQTVPNVSGSPPLSPIDMETQERIKLERKRLRNRIAASKCRRRKLERIGRLEEKVRILKGENAELQGVVNKLRDQVCSLKQEVMEHVNSGCQIPFVTHQ